MALYDAHADPLMRTCKLAGFLSELILSDSGEFDKLDHLTEKYFSLDNNTVSRILFTTFETVEDITEASR